MNSYGQRVLDRLKSYDANFVSPGNKEGVYNVDTKDFSAEVYVVPGNSFGIEIVSKSNSKLRYFFDDDLYNMSSPKYADFFNAMEEDILAILEALRANTVLTGSRKGRPAMVIPGHNKYLLVYLTKLFGGTGTITYNGLDELKEKGNFTPLA